MRNASSFKLAILFSSSRKNLTLNLFKAIMQNKIKELRAKHNLTQQELAEKVSVRRETIVFLEMGKYNPSLKLAFQIAKVFALPIEEIFFFSNEDLEKK